MTLTAHIENCLKLVEEVKAKGFDPTKVECFTTHGASGDCNELSSGSLDEIDGNETMGPVIDLEVGTPYINFYIGN